MSISLRTEFDFTEAIVDEDCGLKKFYKVANALTDDLEIKFTNKDDDFDTLDWSFVYKGRTLRLHYNIYTGIKVYPHNRSPSVEDNNAVVEVAKHLENKFPAPGK